MLMEVKKHLKLLKQYFIFNLKCSLEYRASFIIQVIGMIINNSSFLFFWWVLYSNVDTIGGYTFSDTMILWGLASSTYGFTHIIFGNVQELSNTIITGELDSYIIQPKDIVINSCASRTQVSAWGDLIYGYILFAISGRAEILPLLLYTLFIATGGIIYFASLLIVNSLALYFGNIEGTKRIVEMFILAFSTYPEGIFGKYFRFIFYTLIPVGFMSFLPVNIMKEFNAVGILAVITSAILYVFIGYRVFYGGLKRYESGNMMEAKI